MVDARSGSFFAGLNGAPAWSPDGSKIAFCRVKDDVHEVRVVNADGSASVTGRENSRHRKRPPGFSTRRASRSAAETSVTLRIPKLIT